VVGYIGGAGGRLDVYWVVIGHGAVVAGRDDEEATGEGTGVEKVVDASRISNEKHVARLGHDFAVGVHAVPVDEIHVGRGCLVDILISYINPIHHRPTGHSSSQNAPTRHSCKC